MKNVLNLLYILCLIACSVAIVFFIIVRSDAVENKGRYVFLAFGLLVFSIYRLSKLTKNEAKEPIGHSIKNPIELYVNLSDVTVYDASYIREEDEATSIIKGERRALDNMVGHQTNDFKKEITQCYFDFKVFHNDMQLTYSSPIINKDMQTLHIKLLIKKETVMYVNKDNPEEYYIDLEFLYN